MGAALSKFRCNSYTLGSDSISHGAKMATENPRLGLRRKDNHILLPECYGWPLRSPMQAMRQSQDHRCTHSLRSVARDPVGPGRPDVEYHFSHLQGETSIVTVFMLRLWLEALREEANFFTCSSAHAGWSAECAILSADAVSSA